MERLIYIRSRSFVIAIIFCVYAVSPLAQPLPEGDIDAWRHFELYSLNVLAHIFSAPPEDEPLGSGIPPGTESDRILMLKKRAIPRENFPSGQLQQDSAMAGFIADVFLPTDGGLADCTGPRATSECEYSFPAGLSPPTPTVSLA